MNIQKGTFNVVQNVDSLLAENLNMKNALIRFYKKLNFSLKHA